MERLLRKKEYAPQALDIKKIVLSYVLKAKSGGDPSLEKRFLYYAGVPKSDNEFKLEETGTLGESVDVSTEVDGKKKIAFRVGLGSYSVFFVNNEAIENRMITKFKKRDEIKSFEELELAIDRFIRLDPKEDELIDVSKEKLNSRKVTQLEKPQMSEGYLRDSFRKNKSS